MLLQLATIAKNSFIEALRQPIFAVMILLGGLLLIVNPSLAMYSMEHGADNKMLIDMSLSTVFLCSLFLAAFTASGVISHEIETRTVLTVISKPVNRPTFIIGKYIGIAGAIAIAYYVLSIIFLLTVRHRVLSTAADRVDWPVVLFGLLGTIGPLIAASAMNYYAKKPFPSTFAVLLAVGQTVAFALVLVIDKQWVIQSPLEEFTKNNHEMAQITVGLAVIFQAVLILTALAVACSTRFGTVMTLLIAFGAFILGLISNSLNQLVNQRLEIPVDWAVMDTFAPILASGEPFYLKGLFLAMKSVYLLFPNLQFLWPADAITQGHPFSFSHFMVLLAYTSLHIIALLSLAVVLFQRREVG